jgi:hypothetical protein
MKKNDILKIIDITSFTAVCIATALVVAFQIVSEPVMVTIAMSFYALGFLGLSAQFGFKIYEDFFQKRDELIKSEGENDTVEEAQTKQLDKSSKKSKIWNIVGFAGSFLVFVFTLVVIILY